jgi:hypothetical protein
LYTFFDQIAFGFSDIEELGVVREIAEGVLHLRNDVLRFSNIEMCGQFE